MTIVSAVQEANAADLARDHRDPVRRISQFLDPGSLHVVRQRAGLGVVIARGRIEGSKVIVFCTDATTSGGAIGGAECSLIAAAIEAASSERCPVIGIWHSGGAKLAEGVVAMDGIGRMFAAMVRASGQVLQLSLILGPAAGGAAYGAALTDLVIMSDGGRVFIVVGLGRIGGRTVGVIANNPLRKGGCLDSLGRESGAICSHVRRIRHTASRAGRRTGLSSGHQPGVGRGGPSRREAPARVRRGSRPPGNPGDPEIVRRLLHCDELALPRRHRGARLA